MRQPMNLVSVYVPPVNSFLFIINHLINESGRPLSLNKSRSVRGSPIIPLLSMQMGIYIEKDECLPWLHLVKQQARILPSLTPALN